MALKIIPPGARKGNKHWIVRGSIGGRVYEASTHETDEKRARRFAAELERRLTADPQSGDRITFAQAAQRYIEFRSPNQTDLNRIERLVARMGKRLIREIKPAELHDAANGLAPGMSPATKNRNVLRPAVTILHHAANAGLCEWIRVQAFKEPRPKTRAIAPDAATALIEAAAPGPQRRLLVWLFYQGTRITETLRVQWADVDFDRLSVRVYVRKTDTDREFPLHAAVVSELNLVPKAERTGSVFPWRLRGAVYAWLPSVAEKAGVRFTPHMGRHTLGTMMAANGASLRAIMGALGHTSASSSLRYQDGDMEMVRRAAAAVVLPPRKKLGKIA